MRRYFYADPLAAAWMTKHFRMKLVAGDFCLQPESVPAFLRKLGDGFTADRIFAHPESLPLLEPKVGDVVEDDSRSKVRRLTAAHFPYQATLRQILQRNGKPFHWPERADG